MLSLMRLDLKRSILSLSGFRSCSESEDELSEISLTNEIFKMLLEGTTLNSSVIPVVVVGTILLCFRTGWIMLEWFQAFTQGWPSMARKTCSIGSFSGVKSASVLKTRSWLCEGFGCTNLWASCPRLCP